MDSSRGGLPLTRRQAIGAAAGAAAGLAGALLPRAAWADASSDAGASESGSAGFEGFLYAVMDPDTSLWGYMDAEGVMVIEPRFSDLSSNPDLDARSQITLTSTEARSGGVMEITVAAGLAVGVFQGSAETVKDADTEKWGLVARDGSWIVEPVFDAVTAVVEGSFLAATVEGGDATLSYWTSAGEKLFDCSADIKRARVFCGGIASVESEDGWALIDDKGAWRLKSAENPKEPYCYSAPLTFSEGVAWDSDGAAYVDAQGGQKFNLESWNNAPYKSDFSAGLWSDEGRIVGGVPLDASGNTLKEKEDPGGAAALNTNAVFGASARTKFSEGVCAVICAKHETWGAVDASGNWVIPPRYDNLEDFHEGYAFARDLSLVSYGVIDASGNWVVAPRFSTPDIPSRFAGGLAYAVLRVNDVEGDETEAHGWITPQGRWVRHWGRGLEGSSDETDA